MDSSDAGSAEQVQARVKLWWLPGHTLWWDPRLRGTRAQIGSALEELATRVEVDSLARLVLGSEPFAVVHYSVVVSTHGAVLQRHETTVLLRDMPDRLREHAMELAGHHEVGSE